MTPAYEELPKAVRRRLLLIAVLRTTVTGGCLLVAYYVLPMDRPYSGSVAVELVVGLLLVALIIAYQARAIASDPYPRMRAAMALGISLPVFLLLFATVYYKLAQNDPATFTEQMGRTDSLYFTVTVFSSVGFGDIAPKLDSSRIPVMIQMLGDLAVFGVAARIIINAVQVGVHRAERGAGPEPEQPAQ